VRARYQIAACKGTKVSRVVTAFGIIVGAPALLSGLHGQGASATELKTACVACGITMEPALALPLPHFPGPLNPLSVRVDSRGRYLVATGTTEYFQFDGNGAPVVEAPRTPGKRRFSWVDHVAATNDGSIYVFDAGAHKYFTLTSGMRVARTDSLPDRVGSGIAFLKPGRFVVNMFVPTPDLAPYPLHVVEHGAVLNSFGITPGISGVRADLPATTHRHISKASDSTIWVAPLNQYRIELWSVSGRLLGTFVRTPEPFPLWIHDPAPSAARPPLVRVSAIHADQGGAFLWVLLRVPDRDWRSALTPVVREGRRSLVANNPDKYYDTVIEVIDLQRRAVVRAQRVDQHLRGFATDHSTFSIDLSDAQKPIVRIWNMNWAK
jgi:hypothetical protein